MALLEWLEATSLAEWARISLEGYPSAIAAHSIGLAVMVGPILILDLRLLGWFRSIPLNSMSRILSVAWLGFALNFASGAVLFVMQATSYITNYPFLIKLALVLLGAITAAQQQSAIRNAEAWDRTGIPSSVTAIAVLSLIFWIGAIITGRLIAYITELQPVIMSLAVLIVLGIALFAARQQRSAAPA